MGGIMIGGVSSGSGKTTVMCGILKALKSRGVNTVSCKCGPDYIDPMFHTEILGVPSKNTDSFFCDDRSLRNIYAEHTQNSHIAVVEGVMGYYDGISISTAEGSSYDIAKKLGIPVILVVNAKGMAMTVKAVIKGIIDYKNDSNIKGVILNNISSGVYTSLKDSIENELNIKVVGFLPSLEKCSFKSRHLGLVTPKDDDINKKVEILGEAAERYINIDLLIEISESAEKIQYEKIEFEKIGKGVKIGIARDEAFCFYYKDNIEILEKMGCEIEYFSPIRDKKMPENVNGVIFGGGYPELYLKELSENKSMLEDVKNSLENGLPCLAECGGFMYLHNEIADKENNIYKMAGLIDGQSFYCGKLVRFGYITLKAQRDTFIMKKGDKIKAHEFHYWDSTLNGDFFNAEKPSGKRNWDCIHVYKNTVCGFPHLFYYSNTEFIKKFISKCRAPLKIMFL